LPSLDNNICASWTQTDQQFYNRMPFYFVQEQASYRDRWSTWKPLLETVAWQPNEGDTMRSIMLEHSPIIRQQAYGSLLKTTPVADIGIGRERIVNTQLYWQDFVSPHFNFLASFQDFADRTMSNMKEVVRMMDVFSDMYYRTQIWENSPYVYVAGFGLIEAPVGPGDAAHANATGKNANWLNGTLLPALLKSSPGNLSFQEVWRALNAAETIIGMEPFEGTGKPQGDNNPLDYKYALIQSGESWNNFLDDPWLKENRPLNMNIVSEGFRGSLFGRVTSRLEKHPLRYAVGPNGLTTPDPEIVELNPNAWDYGRCKPNPYYAKSADPNGNSTNYSDIEVGFLVGGRSYKAVNVGAPPSAFSAKSTPESFTKMTWNGQPYMTKNFFVPCRDTNGNATVDFNSWGRYLRFQGTAAMGIAAINPQNILPIVFKRRYSLTTVG